MASKRKILTHEEFDTIHQMITTNNAPKIIIKTFKKSGRIRFGYDSLRKTILWYFDMHWDTIKKRWVEIPSLHPYYKLPKDFQLSMFTTSININQSENNPKPLPHENPTIKKSPPNSSKTNDCKINLNGKLKPIIPLIELELAIAGKESPYSLAIPGNDIVTIIKNIHVIEQTITQIQKSINSMNHNLSVLVNHYNELN
ncbi:hypothetical protein OW763_02665 [Clostridium aestuarii]|uniref:Uncharacterized protein n=1 Tax=Clostridium aestuarii TaxID=338193 RepID=A0ABT4CW76_9CLOT|nr:hypothetical protein [Clostridium aestuarii]MCY6483257.1 hypothetical protein [Clostridium aestuarii]